MLTATYRKRLEADLAAWVAAGLVTPDSANAIRLRAQEQAGGVKLPAILGMLGGLLLASSVAAFVAANWALMPRPARVAMILAALAGALFTAHRLARNGPSLASDAAATCASLIFLAGVALVGQMYHLPADWAAGALTVGIGAFIVAALLRSDGALVVTFAACLAWLLTDFGETGYRVSPAYLLLCAPAVVVALGRESRIVHHAAVLAVGAWLALHGSVSFGDSDWPGVLAYWLAIAVAFTAIGWLALERGRPALLAACLPWGLAGYVVALMMQLLRILERSASSPGHASVPVVVAGLAAVAAIAGLAVLSRDRRFGALLAAALALACAVPLVFWSGLGQALPGRAAVGLLVLASSALLVAAGAAAGLRTVTLAGSTAFAAAVLILLWRTIGSLIDQSLFFLVGGALLLVAAGAMRKLLARTAREAAP